MFSNATAGDPYASIYNVSYLNLRALVRSRCPDVRYRSLPSLQLTSKQGAGATKQKGNLTCQQKRLGPTRVWSHKSATKVDTALPRLAHIMPATSCSTEIACSNYSDRLRSGRLATDFACLVESLSQRCAKSIIEGNSEEEALFADKRRPLESGTDGVEPYVDCIRQDCHQADPFTSVSDERQLEGNERKGSLTFYRRTVSVLNPMKPEIPKRRTGLTDSLSPCDYITSHLTTIHSNSVKEPNVKRQKQITNSTANDLVARLSMSPRGASQLRPTPGYAGFIPRSPVRVLQEPFDYSYGLSSSSANSYRPLPSSEYKVLEFAHKGPLSRAVTLTSPFNPFY